MKHNDKIRVHRGSMFWWVTVPSRGFDQPDRLQCFSRFDKAIEYVRAVLAEPELMKEW